MTPTTTQPVTAVDHDAAARKAHPVRVAALFGLAGVGVLAIVWFLVQQLGLPDWVFLGAIALLAIGLPIMLVTGQQERRRALARASAMQHTTPVGLQRHFTWRKAVMGGVAAFIALAVTAGGYAGLRAMGVGPFGTLVASGALGSRDRLILADFENATPDSTVAESVTELLRIDLSQSQVVSVLEPRAVNEVLARMRKERGAKITADLAAEIATREGIKAYIAGDVRGVGTGFVVSARLVDVANGQVLVAGRETATNSGELIAAVDRLSRHLRERIGESLRTIRADPPLEQLTTGSLDALRLYSQATRFVDRGDNDRAIALLEQTVVQDSTFAMAWRRIAVLFNNRGGFENTERAKAAMAKAYALRDRLSDRERLHIEAFHANVVERDWEKAATAYLAIIEKHPDDVAALNNLAVMYSNLARYEDRDAIVRRTLASGFAPTTTYTNFIGTRLDAGDPVEAESTLVRLLEKVPDFTAAPQYRSDIARARRDWGTAEAEARKLLTGAPAPRQFANFRLGMLAEVHGRLSEGARYNAEGARIAAERSGTSVEESRLDGELDEAERAVWLPNADAKALAQRYEALWRRQQVLAQGRPARQQNYLTFVGAFARLDRPDRSRALLAEYRGKLTPGELEETGLRFDIVVAEADIARAEGRHEESIRLFQSACEPYRKAFADCDASVDVAEVYDLAGQADSALAIYERYLALEADRNVPERIWYPRALRRAGQIHEAKGNREKALEYYGKFVELWKDADPVLQPMVRETRQWIAQLAGERK
jgi:tetratricopeptide (TPR) repeat protein